MGRRIAFVMNAATNESVGLLRYGCRDTDRVFALMTNPALGGCDSKLSRKLCDGDGLATFQREFFNGLLKRWSSADQLILYFSGHGIARNNVYSLLLGPNETDALPFANLLNDLQSYGVTRYILILDACHSGLATKGAMGSLLDFQLANIPKGNVVVASCEAWEQSKEHPPAELSVFTHLLVQGVELGLEGERDREFMLVEDVMAYVEQSLQLDEFRSYLQSPRRKVTDADANLWIARNVHFQSSAAQESGDDSIVTMNVTWQMPMLKFPLPAESLQTLATLLEEIRQQVVSELSKCAPERVSEQHIRANVFLPDHKKCDHGGIYNLFMHQDLRANMEFEPEWDLRFAPGQGATGEAFSSKQAVLTFRQTELDGGWQHRFKLTEVHQKAIHPQLRWILSIPILDESTGEPLATLSIDGLEYPIDQRILESIPSVIIGGLKAFSSVLSSLPKIQVLVGWSE